jgi:hypothetical protein
MHVPKYSPPLSEKEYFLFFSLIIGFAFFCHLLTLLLPGGISENEETYIYFLFLGVCPLLTYLAYHTVDFIHQNH